MRGGRAAAEGEGRHADVLPGRRVADGVGPAGCGALGPERTLPAPTLGTSRPGPPDRVDGTGGPPPGGQSPATEPGAPRPLGDTASPEPPDERPSRRPETVTPLGALFIELLTKDPAWYVSVLATVVLSVTLHELGHAYAALRQGDETPRLLGRLTLDPLVHMGPQSLFMAAFLGIAWGVTPVNPSRFRGRHGESLVAFAGPAVNLVLALIGLTALALVLRAAGPAGLRVALGDRNNLHLFLLVFGITNLLLFLFNMLPIPPLDGSTIAADFLPGYRRLAGLPEAQPWFMAAAIAALLLLPLSDWAGELAARYVALWMR